MAMSMITLLKYFTVAAANGGSFISEWVRVPGGFQHWQFVVLVHGRISTTAGSVQLQTTWDTNTVANLGSSTNLATAGLSSIDLTSGMGPMVRVSIASTADSVATISIFLTPKST
jgi:hypothetical protein